MSEFTCTYEPPICCTQSFRTGSVTTTRSGSAADAAKAVAEEPHSQGIANARNMAKAIRRNIRRTVTPDFCKVNAKAGGDCARMIRAMLDPLPGFRLA